MNWHIGFEGMSIVMSFCIFFYILLYHCQRQKPENDRIHVHLFSVGLLDTLHTLTYNGMPGILEFHL